MPLIPTTRRADGSRSITMGLNITLLSAAITGTLLHFLGALVVPTEVLVGYVNTLVLSVVGLVLRSRTVQPLEDDARRYLRKGSALLLLFVLSGCATSTAVDRSGADSAVRAAIYGTSATLRWTGSEEAAQVLEESLDDLAAAVVGSLEWPTDTKSIAHGVTTTVCRALIEVGQDAAARIVRLAEGFIHWGLEQLLAHS